MLFSSGLRRLPKDLFIDGIGVVLETLLRVFSLAENGGAGGQWHLRNFVQSGTFHFFDSYKGS